MRKLLVLCLLLASPAHAGIFGGGPECVVGGCSGQLCVDANGPDIASSCEWTEAYGCYPKFGECKEQENGKCGWTQSEALLHCLTYPKRNSMEYPEPEESPLHEFITPKKPILNP